MLTSFINLLAFSTFILSLSSTTSAAPSGSKTAPYIARRNPVPGSAPVPRSSTPWAPSPEQLLKDAEVKMLIDALAQAAVASSAVKRSLDRVANVNDIFSRDLDSETSAIEKRAAAGCLDSTANDVTINSLFYYGGAGTVVTLCPNAKISLTNPIFYTAPNQILTTQGNPTNDTRATLTVTGPNQSYGILGTCANCANITLSNVQVDGSRPLLGHLATGGALIELGGDNGGQLVQHVKVFEPRGWSALHAMEGATLSCTGMSILNNEVGPSGNPPNNGQQFNAKRDAVITPGQWADGISLACRNSIVRHNTLVDTTDGAIVIFGAPGSLISNNVIKAVTRQALGGINAVDFAPFGGNYTSTIVENNLIIAQSTMLKVGMGIGGMVWGSDNRTSSQGYSGTFRNNVFSSGPTGYFGYAIAVAGQNSPAVYNNLATTANFGGGPSAACIPGILTPTPQAFVYDPFISIGAVLQSNFVAKILVFLVCNQAGPIVSRGPVTPLVANSMIGSPKALALFAQTLHDSSSNSSDSAAPVAAAAPAVGGLAAIGNLAAKAYNAALATTPASTKLRARDEPSVTGPAPSRVTPRSVNMVNPFEILERTRRLR